MEYFHSHIDGQLRYQYDYFLAARLCDLGTIKRRNEHRDISLAKVRIELTAFFHDREWSFSVEDLIGEYPAYLGTIQQHLFSSGTT